MKETSPSQGRSLVLAQYESTAEVVTIVVT